MRNQIMRNVLERRSIFLAGLLSLVLAGCSMQANISNLPSVFFPETPIEKVDRLEPDFVVGEVVTTSSGAELTGSFGEVSEKTTSANGHWSLEGVFYE